jgi:RNA polymerase sigma-70 factor (ECF subfamily)
MYNIAVTRDNLSAGAFAADRSEGVMSELQEFRDLVARIRAGDEQAAAELVSRYEPLIRREVRLRLEDRRLTRTFDSVDVCQSVLASFFVRAAAGQYDLDEPGQLAGLLVRMARNKLASVARHQHRQRRDHRRTAGAAADLEHVAGGEPTPSRIVAGKELLADFLGRLTDEERQIAALRGQGLAWAEVADQLGGTARARRMQMSRAAARVGRAMGLDADADADEQDGDG